jgi:proteasome lid subunit RPN8/RPN11
MISFQEHQWNQILTHLNRCLPEEACGLVGGIYEDVHTLYPVTNILHSPSRFKMDPQEQVNALFSIEEEGETLLAIYHSHPTGPQGMSSIDMEEHVYPEAAQLIFTPCSDTWKCSAFRLVSEMWEEFDVQVVKR